MLQRILLLAQRTADETIADARADAERIRAEARDEAASLVARAQGELDRSMGDLEATRQALEQRVEELRAFEREYRGRLRTFLQARLTELEKHADAGAPDTGAPGAGSGADRSTARRGAGSAPRG